MGFWVMMLLSALLVPAVMLGVGLLFLRAAPKNINGVFGYRTALSMKNQDTWDFAHKHCGRVWLRVGGVLLALTLVVMLLCLRMEAGRLGWVVTALSVGQMAVLLLSILPTWFALKRTFDADGKRRGPGGEA